MAIQVLPADEVKDPDGRYLLYTKMVSPAPTLCWWRISNSLFQEVRRLCYCAGIIMPDRTTIVLPLELKRRAVSRARTQGISFAEYIRRAVTKDLLPAAKGRSSKTHTKSTRKRPAIRSGTTWLLSMIPTAPPIWSPVWTTTFTAKHDLPRLRRVPGLYWKPDQFHSEAELIWRSLKGSLTTTNHAMDEVATLLGL